MKVYYIVKTCSISFFKICL